MYTLWTGYPATTTRKTDHKIEGIRVSMNTISTSINMPACTSIQDVQTTTCPGCALPRTKVAYNTGLATQGEEVTQGTR